MLTTDEIEIDGQRFRVVQLPATRAERILMMCMRALGPSFGKVVTSSGRAIQTGDLTAVDLAGLGEAIGVVFDHLTPDEFIKVRNELLSGAVWLDDERAKPLIPGAYDLVFKGRVLSALKLVRFAFEVNFGDFFDAARSFAGRAPVAAREPSASLPASSGSSGAS